MSDVFTFLETELSSISSDIIIDDRLRESCIKLNKLLNYVKTPDYRIHLKHNVIAIREEMNVVNDFIHKELYIDLSKVIDLLERFQRGSQILARDHYYHSIQCFLLAIVLVKKFYPYPDPLPENIVAILYSLTLYHDIGYLYYSKDTSEEIINEDFANFFSTHNLINEGDVERTLCLNTEPYQPIDLVTDINETIENDNSINNIWKSGSSGGEDLIEKDPDLPSCCVRYKSSHAYKSALIIKKILYTKNIKESHYAWMLKEKIDSKKNWFKGVLKAIYLHDMKCLSPLLEINTDFYSVYLMIIDELQTYGRLIPSDTYQSIINPQDVGFHWDPVNPKNLCIDIVTTNTELRQECAAHDPSTIISTLNQKIDARSLANII